MANSKATITIGVPVYNEEKYLEETLKSLQNQTYQKIKILVSDNFSTDNSVAIVKKLQKNDSRIQLIKQKENIGATENFKFLIDIANTEFFMWMGAHDIISNSYVEDSIKILQKNKNAVLIYHRAIFFTKNIQNVGKTSYSEIDTRGLSKTRRLMKIINVLGSCTAVHGVFRTKIAKKIPFVKMVGPDHLMLFAVANMGHILEIDKNGFFRRQTNINESIKERRKRYEQYKMFQSKRISPSIKFVTEHIKYTFNITNISFFNKIFVAINIIARVFANYIIFEIFRQKKTQ